MIFNHLLGFYRYSIVNKYSATIQYEYVLKGFENTANLTLDCSGDKEISVKAYPSRVLDNDYIQITNTTTVVSEERTFTMKWIAKYCGHNYLEFKIKEGVKYNVKTGIWYNVMHTAKHDIKVRLESGNRLSVKD